MGVLMKSLRNQVICFLAAVACLPHLNAEEKKANNSVPPAEKAFEVRDLPKPEPIEGQLGEPGAPSLAESQAKLAKAMLDKGICNESYYGEEFCKKQASRTFRVQDEIRMEHSAVGAESLSE